MQKDSSLIQKLKNYFEKRENVLLAFLFGSQAKKCQFLHEGSDWDIAVYLKPEGKRLERETQERDFSEIRQKMWAELSLILKTDAIDLIILNQAYAPIAAAAIKGFPLTIKDRKLYLEFMLATTREAYDFYETAQNYYKIFSRCASLSREDVVLLEKRLSFLEAEIEALSKYKDISWQDYQTSDEKRKILERTIENLSNALIDISQIILAASRKPTPQSYRAILLEAVAILSFSEQEAQTFSDSARVRNILAHEYLDYRWKDLSQFLVKNVPLFPLFVAKVKKFLEENQTKIS